MIENRVCCYLELVFCLGTRMDWVQRGLGYESYWVLDLGFMGGFGYWLWLIRLWVVLGLGS